MTSNMLQGKDALRPPPHYTERSRSSAVAIETTNTATLTSELDGGLLSRGKTRIPPTFSAFGARLQQRTKKQLPLSPVTPTEMPPARYLGLARGPKVWDDVAVVDSGDDDDGEEYVRFEPYSLQKQKHYQNPGLPDLSQRQQLPTPSDSETVVDDESNCADSVESSSWEDEGLSFSLRSEDKYDDNRYYNDAGKLVFKHQTPRVLSKKSFLSDMVKEARAEQQSPTSSIDSSETIPAETSSIVPPSSFKFPNPLRCHPTSSSSGVACVLPDKPATPPEATQGPISFARRPSSPHPVISAHKPSTTQDPTAADAAGRLICIPQLAGGRVFKHRTPRITHSPRGRPLLTMPFNGSSGPRANPVVVMGDTRYRELSSIDQFVGDELSTALEKAILKENRSKYVFRHYGLRAKDAEDGTSQQAATHPESDSHPNDKSERQRKFHQRDNHGNPPRRAKLVDYDLSEPWDSGMDYHSKGW